MHWRSIQKEALWLLPNLALLPLNSKLFSNHICPLECSLLPLTASVHCMQDVRYWVDLHFFEFCMDCQGLFVGTTNFIGDIDIIDMLHIFVFLPKSSESTPSPITPVSGIQGLMHLSKVKWSAQIWPWGETLYSFTIVYHMYGRIWAVSPYCMCASWLFVIWEPQKRHHWLLKTFLSLQL